METRIGATQAARTFSDLINRVRYRGEEFVIERGGQPVCRVVPVRPVGRTVADLVQVLRSTPAPDPGYWDALEEIIEHQPALPKSPWRR
jgi:antitoxin (DNA-binding transcriptional repressor) of toxin-antitoxin stability system